MRPSRHAVALLVPALLFGLLVAAQWQTQLVTTAVSLRQSAPLTQRAEALQGEQNGLKAQLAELRASLDEIQSRAATQSEAARALRARVDELKAASGLAAANGDGIVVHLEDVRVPGAPGKEPERPACYANDLADIVNAAWRGGATAVALNDERIVATSSVYCVGTTIVVNGSLVSTPFRVVALGRGDELLRAFEDPDQLRDLKKRRDANAVAFRVARGIALGVPAFSGSLSVRFAEPRR